MGGIRVLDHYQPLRVLGVVLTGQGVPYELGFLGDTEAFGQGLGHLFRRVAVGQDQYVSYRAELSFGRCLPCVSSVGGSSIIHLTIVR